MLKHGLNAVEWANSVEQVHGYHPRASSSGYLARACKAPSSLKLADYFGLELSVMSTDSLTQTNGELDEARIGSSLERLQRLHVQVRLSKPDLEDPELTPCVALEPSTRYSKCYRTINPPPCLSRRSLLRVLTKSHVYRQGT